MSNLFALVVLEIGLYSTVQQYTSRLIVERNEEYLIQTPSDRDREEIAKFKLSNGEFKEIQALIYDKTKKTLAYGNPDELDAHLLKRWRNSRIIEQVYELYNNNNSKESKMNAAMYIDYHIQAFIYIECLGVDKFKDKLQNSNRLPSETVFEFEDRIATEVSFKALTPIKIKSTPKEATVRCDDITRKKPTDDVYFLSREDLHIVELMKDGYEKYQKKDFNAAKEKELDAVLKEKK
jgi:hypothetical protein